MHELTHTVVDAFAARWGHSPTLVAAAPGRVNIIGEHTDYTGGFVLPAAINREIIIAVSPIDEPVVRGWSVDFEHIAESPLGDYDPCHPAEWFRYILGVLTEAGMAGIDVRGFEFAVGGNVPVGSGLSSSAALETAAFKALEGLLAFEMPDAEAALLCQRAENNFVGMNCGIMDQFISRTGRAGHAVMIDCTDLSTRFVAMNTPGCSWLVVDSNKRRGLVDSEYNARRRECEQGLSQARDFVSSKPVAGLRDLTTGDLARLESRMDDTVFRRIRHVVSENERVLQAVSALEAGDTGTVGELLYGSHASLRDDFEVSCSELDQLVAIIADTEGSIGARLTGAGFGGCVLALVRDEAVGDVTDAILQHYTPETLSSGTTADIWPVSITDGARLL